MIAGGTTGTAKARWGRSDVERVHSWINRFRRLLIRWEKKPENYEAMLKFACGIIAWEQAILLG